jgi:hypothetical protein
MRSIPGEDGEPCAAGNGLGATVPSVFSYASWLVVMSHHKHWVFLVAGILILSNFVYVYAIAPKIQARNGAVTRTTPRAAKRRAGSAG